MSPFHPTKRDLIVVLLATTVLGIFLQFDFSLRFTDSHGSKSLLGLKVGIGGYRDDENWDYAGTKSAKGSGRKGSFLDNVEKGAKYSQDQLSGMADTRVRWGQNGPARTEVLAHAPGWTIFDQVYLQNGTWFIVVDNPSKIPLLRMMTSPGKEIWNDKDSIEGREPTDKDMKIIFPKEATMLFGNSASRVAGTTLLINDPPQFLDHYYHFAAEMLVGLWRTYASLDPTITPAGVTHLPSPSRLIFPHTQAGKWNDYAKMNSFLLRAIFPSMSYEYQEDFLDRADTARAYAFEKVVFADRAAAFRGTEFQRTWRTASEALTLSANKFWWAPIRKNLLEFVGSGNDISTEDISSIATEEELYPEEEDIEALEAEENAEDAEMEEELEKSRKTKQKFNGKPVITYVSRQDWGRRMLIKEDHEKLVQELKELEKKYGWEVNIVAMDKLTRDEQIRLSARTTIMMGVHGNGLTHLLWMNNQNPRTTVIEFFFPGGFAEDYEFTARALGIKHYGTWGDTTFTAPNNPQINYPEGFQGNEIPVDGKVVADLVVQRLLVDNKAERGAGEEGDVSLD